MLELGRTEEVIREMDKLANEDHTHSATEEEFNVSLVSTARRARSLRCQPLDVCVTCTSQLKVFLSLISSTLIVIHERFSLTSPSSLSTLT